MKQIIKGKRPGLTIGASIYLLFNPTEQQERHRQAFPHSNEQSELRNNRRIAVCEHCGRQIAKIDAFWWRLYGICSTCNNKATPVWIDDVVEVFWMSGKMTARWKRNGGAYISTQEERLKEKISRGG